MPNKIFILTLLFLLILNVRFYIDRGIFFTNKNLEISILNVGQGDAILIKTPNNKFGLIDVGKNNNILRPLGSRIPAYIKEFEFVILTHPDADHIEGFLELCSRYKIKNLFMNKTKKENSLIKEIINKVTYYKILNYSLSEENDFKIEEVYFDILWPEKDYNDLAESNTNESSIALIIKYKDFTLFAGGDLGKENELKAIENLIGEQEVDILKVNHHGSVTSTSIELLDIISPKYGVISVGAGNRYGHPNEDVIKMLDKKEIKILRTDLENTYTFSTDGGNLWGDGKVTKLNQVEI